MSKIVKYNSVLTAGFNLYNACDIDYFNMAIGTNFQSVSGLLNFGTNILNQNFVSLVLELTRDERTEFCAYVLDVFNR